MAPRMQCLVGIHYYLVDLFCFSSAVAWWKAGLATSYMTTLGHAPLQASREGKMPPCVEVLHWSVCKGRDSFGIFFGAIRDKFRDFSRLLGLPNKHFFLITILNHYDHHHRSDKFAIGIILPSSSLSTLSDIMKINNKLTNNRTQEIYEDRSAE